MRLDVPAAGSDEFDEPFWRLGFRDAGCNQFLAGKKVNLSWRRSDITKIGVGHFPWTVYDAPHDGDLDPDEV